MVNPDNGTPNNETDGGTASIKNDENVAATDDSKKSQDQQQQKQEQDEQEQPQQQAAPGEASLLVSEFPPPPSYFRNYNKDLKPPPIPTESLARGTRRAKAAATQVREQAEALRLAEQNSNNDDNTGAILGGVTGDGTTTKEEEAGEVVAVFGEVVEDPYLVEPLDACEDPTAVIEEVQRLNRIVLDGFVQLVQDLVERPTEHKYVIWNSANTLFCIFITSPFCRLPSFAAHGVNSKTNAGRDETQHIFNAAGM